MNSKAIRIIGVPLDLGAGRRGVDMGPSALRVAGILDKVRKLGWEVEDAGDIDVQIPETQKTGNEKLRFAEPVLAANEALANAVLQALSDERIPLVLGGDHSIAIGSLAGVSTYFAETRGEPIGVMWIDAHADVNTADTTPSGNIHGMSLGVSLGRGDERFVNVLRPRPKVRGENVALVGIRSLDPPERKILADLGAQVFTMRDIDERGMSAVMRDAIKVVTTGTAGIAVQLDMDAIDPNYAPGTGTPVPGGMTYREAHLCMELLADTEQLISLDVVEINPVLGIENQTAELAVGLVQSALGKRIL